MLTLDPLSPLKFPMLYILGFFLLSCGVSVENPVPSELKISVATIDESNLNNEPKNISLKPEITITFTEVFTKEVLTNSANIILTEKENDEIVIHLTFSLDKDSPKIIKITPNPLKKDKTYSLTIKKDLFEGYKMLEDKVMEFTTRSINEAAKLEALTLTIGGTDVMVDEGDIEGTTVKLIVGDKSQTSAIVKLINISDDASSNAIDDVLTFVNGTSYLIVTAEDGKTMNCYILKLISNLAEINTLVLTIGSTNVEGIIECNDEEKKECDISFNVLDEAIKKSTISKITCSSDATSKEYNDEITFNEGKASIKVTAEDGTIFSYTISLKKITNAITDFKFLADQNEGITSDITGTITGTVITATVPALASLRFTPSIEPNGISILPAANVEQDFKETITYKVTFVNGIKKTYTVNVSIAEPSYTLILGEGGKLNSPNPMEVTKGTVVTIPTPTKTNARFEGWFTNENLTVAYVPTVAEFDLTLYAKWKLQHPITYKLNGGTFSTGISNPQLVDTGTLVSELLKPKKNHDLFKGWYTNTELTTKYTGPVSADIILYAKWIPKVGIELILRGGRFSTSIVNPIVVNSGETPTLPTSSPTREHQVFLGWYNLVTDTTVEQLTAMPLTENKKYYAKWELEKFRLTYEKNGGSFSTIEQVKVQTKVEYNQKPTLPTPIKSNEYFLGWYTDATTNTPYKGEKMTAKLTLYAKWLTVTTAPEFKFTQADNTTFLTADVTATIDMVRKIIWFPLGGGLTADRLTNLTPTISNVTATLSSGTRTDFLAPQTYSLTIGGVAEDYRVQVQPKDKSELSSIIDEATKTENKGNAANLNFIDTSKITDMSLLFKNKVTFNGDVSLWDVSSVVNMWGMFYGATAFMSDLSKWNVSSVEDMGAMFYSATAFTSDLSRWNVGNVTNMGGMFGSARKFNSDLSLWDVSAVRSIRGKIPSGFMNMFYAASAFKSDLSKWDVSNATNMFKMFNNASSFTSDLSSWSVSNVTNMFAMFTDARVFNSELPWDVSKVEFTAHMFNGASKFNGDLSSWNVKSVKSMESMFAAASKFNSDLSGWKPEKVENMSFMFNDAIEFNGDLSSWNVKSVTNMESMFSGASIFTSDLSRWNVGNVTNMTRMFYYAKAFTSELPWNVSNVTTMNYMFAGASKFNGNVSIWDVSSVTDMRYMFYNAKEFNRVLTKWEVSGVENHEKMFENASAMEEAHKPNFN